MERPPLHPWFDVADTAPLIDLKRPDGRSKPPSRMAGRTAVLHCLDGGGDSGGDPDATALALQARRTVFAEAGADLYLVRRSTPVQNLALVKKHDLDIEVLSDEPGALAHNVELKGPGTVVIDRGTRIAAVLPSAGAALEDHLDQVLARARALADPGFREGAGTQAPVILVPRVLSPDWCRWLRHIHDHEGNQPSGFMQNVKGESLLLQDAEVKVRRDHVIATRSQLEKAIEHIFARRLIPEIQKATHCPIQRHEEFKIVRYMAEEGGHFRAHRDNTTQATQTRRFAVTLNLNAGGSDPGADYDGGHLVFPEFGDIGYRPGPGDAVVFSCSLLHEARPVTRGERYVLLAFLH